MAAVWGMEKFHYYLYGGHFTLQTDQKPLVTIFKKYLCNVSPRIQRIAIRNWQYDFNTVWIKGKLNVDTDALSKFIVPKNLQSVYINKIHAGYLGINKSLQKAREYLFWKGYTKDISEAIDKCTLCQENKLVNFT